MKKVYLDNAATTKVDENVLKKMLPYFAEQYGNPSSLHNKGLEAKKAIEEARKIIAQSINAEPKEIVFTSGGTESNNFALKSFALSNKDKGNHIITTKVEHKSTIESCKWLEKFGFETTYLDVDEKGFIDIEDLKNSITEKTILVSIIHGNNEVGTIINLEEIGKICLENKIAFHSDACQSYTKTLIDVKNMNLNMLTINAHKIHGPKGVGALYIKKGTKIDPWQHGGNHENKMRASTENVPGIIGFAEAVKIALTTDYNEMRRKRNKLIEGILKIKGTKLNGPRENRLPNNANISFKTIEGEAIGGLLNVYGISSSTGSACSESNLEPSYVLKALKLSDEEANGSLRLSLNRFTTNEDIDYIIKVLPKIVKTLRKISPFEIEEK